jgi:S-layer protein
VFNIITKVNAAPLNFGTVDVAGVETINLTATDTSPVDTTTGAATISKATLTLKGDAAKTVKITGESDLALTLSDSDEVTLVDASTGFSGKLEFTAGLEGLVVKGGSAADALVANASDVALYGNGGGDTLTVNALADRVNLYGGEGKDTFVIDGASTTVSTYATIRGVDSGDVIKMYDGEDLAAKFKQAKVTLSEGATVTLQALADQAIKDLAAGEMGWFQTAENTYIVLDTGDNSTETFVNGTDVIVMITGLVDLSTASFNTAGLLEIA